MPECRLRSHLRNCTAEGRAIPLGFDQCRKCDAFIPARHRSRHEQSCRGSAVLNCTCSKCGFVFEDELGSGGGPRALINHERACAGPGSAGAIRIRAKAAAKAKAKAKAAP
eukprot:10488465-Alexandrium_andersonii.AAC.1